jgi:hypothetical protein
MDGLSDTSGTITALMMAARTQGHPPLRCESVNSWRPSSDASQQIASGAAPVGKESAAVSEADRCRRRYPACSGRMANFLLTSPEEAEAGSGPEVYLPRAKLRRPAREAHLRATRCAC